MGNPGEPQNIGKFLFLGLYVWGIYKCMVIGKRETTSSRCVFALLLTLVILFITAFMDLFDPPRWVALLILVVDVLLVSVSVVFAFLGLAEMKRNPSLVQGRSQAAWSLVLNTLFFLLVGGSAAVAYVQAREGTEAELADLGPRAGRKPIVFEELNFSIAPARDWVQIRAISRIHPAATVGFRRVKPRADFMVIAEKIGKLAGFTTDDLVDVAEENLMLVGEDYEFERGEVVRHGNAEGREAWGSSSTPDGRFYIHYWIVSHNGYAYQLLATGDDYDRAKIARELRAMASSFQLLNPDEQVLVPLADNQENYTSPDYGYALNWIGSSWSPWPNVRSEHPMAETGALVGSVGACYVSGFHFDKEMTTDELSEALLDSSGFVAETNLSEDSLARSGWKGKQTQFNFNDSSGKYRVLTQVFKRGRRGVSFVAWADASIPGVDEMLEEAADALELSAGDVSRQPARDDAAAFRHGMIYNSLGLADYLADRYQGAATWFLRALKTDGSDSTYLANVANALTQAGRHEQGLAIIEKYHGNYDDAHDVKSSWAQLLDLVGRRSDAIQKYAELFRSGYRDEDDLTNYLALLIDEDRGDEAVDSIEAYRKTSDSPSLVALHANLLIANEQAEDAITLLKPRRDVMSDMNLADAIISAYESAGRTTEALDLIDELLAAGVDETWLWDQKGGIEFDLNWYRQAKESYEQALRLSPGSEPIQEAVTYISSLLGEGDNTSIKTELVAVPLPDALRWGPPTAEDRELAQGQNAAYTHRYRAIQVDEGAPYRRTDYWRVHIAEAAATDQFSSLQFQFDPTVDQIYINRLEVFDENYEQVGSVDVNECYLLDDSSDGMATTNRTLNVPVPSLSKGAWIEAEITRERHADMKRVPFVDFDFASYFPINHYALVVRGDHANFEIETSAGVQRNELSPDVTVFQVEGPMITALESLQPDFEEFIDYVVLTDRRNSWQEETTDYLNDIEDKLAEDPKVRQLAERLTRDTENPIDKALVLAQHVQEAVSYTAIEFGVRGTIPKPAAETLADKFGDCKDHSLLLYQLLKAVDVPAHLALVNASGRVFDEVPSLDQFDHMVVAVPHDGAFRFFDCTGKGYGSDVVTPFGLAERTVLLLDREHPQLVQVPTYDRADSNIMSGRSISLSEDGRDISVEERVILRGYYGGFFRSFLASLSPADQEQAVQSLLAESAPAVELSEFSTESLSDLDQPLKLRLKYRLPEAVQERQGRLLFKAPSVWERYFTDVSFVPNRQTPFELSPPIHIRSQLRVNLPKGFKARLAETDPVTVKPFFATRLSVDETRQQELRLGFDVRQTAGQFGPDQYEGYYRGARQVQRLLNTEIQLVPE